MGLTYKQKLEIANSGGHFQESGPGSWVGKEIRKGDKHGVVISDMNGATRILTVRFIDLTEEKIIMNNIGPNPNPEELKKFEWLCTRNGEENWYNFSL